MDKRRKSIDKFVASKSSNRIIMLFPGLDCSKVTISSNKVCTIRISLALVFTMFTCQLAHAVKQVNGLTVYTVAIDKEYEPYEFINEENGVDGFTPALLREIGKLAGVSFEFKPMTWSEAINKLDSKEVDLISMIYTPKRAQLYEFSLPHSKISQALFCNSEVMNIKDIASLAGHKVGFQHDDFMYPNLANRKDFSKLIFLSKLDGFIHLNNGLVDAFFCAHQSGVNIISTYKLKNVKLVLGNLYPQQFAFATYRGNKELITLINRQILTMKANGRLTELQGIWLSKHIHQPNWFERNELFLATLVGIVLGLVLLLLLWNRSLHLRVASKTKILQDSEEQFRQLTETIQEVFWITDVAKKQMLYISPAYETICGVPIETLYNDPRSWLNFVHQEDRERIANAAYTKQKTGGYDEKYRIVRPDGEIRWIHEKAFPVKNKVGEVYRIVGVAEDFTSIKKIKLKLIEQNTLNEAIINSQKNVIIFALDKNYCYTTFSQSHVQEMKAAWNVDIKVGMNMLECMTIYELRKKAKSSIDRTLCGESFTEIQHQPTTNTYYELSWNPTIQNHAIIGVTSFVQNITERKLSEEKIKRSEEILRTVLDNSPIGIWLLESTGKMVFVNKEYCRAVGISEERFLEVPHYSELYTKDVAETCKESDIETLEFSGLSRTTEHLILADGKLHDLEITKVRISDETIGVKGLIGISRDITESNLAEAKERMSHQRFRLLLDATEQGIFGVDNNGNCTFANKACIQKLGYDTENDLLGKHIHTLIHHTRPDGTNYPANDCRAYKSLLDKTGKHVEDEFFWRKDGTSFPVEYWSRSIFQDNAITGAVITFYDITQRKKTEAFKTLSSDILSILNSNVGLKEMIEMVLKSIQQLTGYSAIGMRLKVGDDYPYFVQRGFSSEFLSTENSIVALDKEGDICRDNDGNPILECTCGLVISGKTNKTNPLYTKSGSFVTNNSLSGLDFSPDKDPRIGARDKCIYLQYASYAIIPIKANDQIIGTLQLNDKNKDAFTEDSINFFESICMNIGTTLMRKHSEQKLILANKELLLHNEERIKRSAELILAKELALQNEEKAKYAAELMIVNAELAKQNEEKEKRSTELSIANKELQQYAYIASHDLQEPLRTVSNYMKVFEEDYFDQLDANGRKYLMSVNRATMRMSILIKALLDFSRLGQNSSRSIVDCNVLIDEVLADLDTMLKTKQANIHVDELPTLNVYETELRQVFQNLLTNAVKFQKKGVLPEIKISCDKTGDKWKFAVSDNGIGIAPIHYERIFEIFKRLHNNESEYQGSGIGLANCKKIIQLHQGEIWLESKLGEGTTFYFTIKNWEE